MNLNPRKGISAFFQDDELKKFIKDIQELELESRLMVNYLSSKSKAVEEDTLNELSELSTRIRLLNEWFQKDQDHQKLQEIYSRIVIVHNQLSQKVSPANAVSIKFTEYSTGFILRKNRVVNWLIILTLVCLILLVLFHSEWKGSSPNNVMLVLVASGLGSGFYTLLTVSRYLVRRLYNPRYNPTYIIRFLLGITAGTILALSISGTDEVNNAGYSMEILAIVGGFAADAVATILKRISQVIVSIFTGSDDNNDSRIKNNLYEIRAKIMEATNNQEVIDEIDKKIKDLEN